MKKDDIIAYLTEKQAYFLDTYGVSFVGIFGSFARDEATEYSDIDILYNIQKDAKLSLFDYLKINHQLEAYFQKKVDLVREGTLKPMVKTYIEKDLMYV